MTPCSMLGRWRGRTCTPSGNFSPTAQALLPDVPKALRDAAQLVYEHGTILGVEDQQDLLARLNTSPSARTQRSVRRDPQQRRPPGEQSATPWDPRRPRRPPGSYATPGPSSDHPRRRKACRLDGGPSRADKAHLREGFVQGVELVDGTARLAAMNMLLHGWVELTALAPSRSKTLSPPTPANAGQS